MLSCHRIAPLEHKRKVHTGVLVHKLRKEIGTHNLVEEYGRQSKSSHRFETRSRARGDMKSVAHNTSKYEKSTLQRATLTWNSIPENIRTIDNTSDFKRKYQAYLLSSFKRDVLT